MLINIRTVRCENTNIFTTVLSKLSPWGCMWPWGWGLIWAPGLSPSYCSLPLYGITLYVAATRVSRFPLPPLASTFCPHPSRQGGAVQFNTPVQHSAAREPTSGELWVRLGHLHRVWPREPVASVSVAHGACSH